MLAMHHAVQFCSACPGAAPPCRCAESLLRTWARMPRPPKEGDSHYHAIAACASASSCCTNHADRKEAIHVIMLTQYALLRCSCCNMFPDIKPTEGRPSSCKYGWVTENTDCSHMCAGAVQEIGDMRLPVAHGHATCGTCARECGAPPKRVSSCSYMLNIACFTALRGVVAKVLPAAAAAAACVPSTH
jgi:hypothetical protein